MAKHSPFPVDVLVGQSIRAARIAAGLSQADLGKACGISFQQVHKYEKGANRVGSSRLMQIAEVLGVSANTLLPVSQKHAVTLKPTILQDRVGMDIVKAWDTLSPEHRIAIRDLIEAIVSRKRSLPA